MSALGPLVARARGLASRLLTPVTLRSLALSADRRAFSDALVRVGYLAFAPNAPPPDEREIEMAIRRVASRRYDVLERWSHDHDDMLVPLVEDEDRRSIRALVRGAMADVAPELRSAGLVPTPTLPARAIDDMALLGSVSSLAAALLAIRHPFARALADEARRERADLFGMEQAIMRAWAARALRTAKHGDAALRSYVEQCIDLQNLWVARLLADHRSDAAASALFVAGGAMVREDDLTFAAQSGNAEALAARVGPRVTHTPLEAALRPETQAPDDAALSALVAEFHQRSRREPLGLAPVIWYVLRLRAEHRTLLRVLWQISLGVPAEIRVRDLERAA